jgi:hypothetical protein
MTLIQKLLTNIQAGRYDTNQLRALWNNIERAEAEKLTEEEKEELIVEIEKILRNNSPRTAVQIFGRRDEASKEILRKIILELELEFDFSDNILKNGVKVGGDMIGGRVYAQTYISYKNEDGHKAEICLHQDSVDSEIIARVVKKTVQRGVDSPTDKEDCIPAKGNEAKYVRLYKELLVNFCGLSSNSKRGRAPQD